MEPVLFQSISSECSFEVTILNHPDLLTMNFLALKVGFQELDGNDFNERLEHFQVIFYRTNPYEGTVSPEYIIPDQ